MLEKELAYYEKSLENWLSLYTGKFVLVKGEELVVVMVFPATRVAGLCFAPPRW